MKVLLPITIRPTGGTSSFARKFRQGMKELGHDVIFSRAGNYDVLLASPRAPLSTLIYAKWHRKPIIHRLDGVYYHGTAAGRLWRLHNLPLRLIRNYFADFIIYQSKFSKDSCNIFLGSTQTPSTIIYNGVDTEVFKPEGLKADIRDNPDQHLFITASRFRRTDQIVPILQAFRLYQQNYCKNSKLVVIGDFSPSRNGEPREALAKWGLSNIPANVEFLGIIPNEELSNYLRAADVFLFTHLNPPCPNNVIEAMACGLPICGVADGSMTELTTPGKSSELANPQTKEYFGYRKINPKTIAENMQIIMKNKSSYSSNSHIIAAKRFGLPNMIDQYLEVFQQVLNS